MAHSRRVWFALLLVMGVLAAAQPPMARAVPSEWAYIGMPFRGTWPSADRYAHPSQHPLATGWDWSTDLFANDTKVYVTVPAASGTVKMRILSVGNACKGTGKSVTVRIDVDGQRVGTMYFTHLDGVPSTVKNAAGTSTVFTTNSLHIGKTKWWPDPDDDACWDVGTSSGVHTHVQADNNGGYSCYINRTPSYPGQVISQGTPIGKLGATAATRRQASCSSTDLLFSTDQRSLSSAFNWTRVSDSASHGGSYYYTRYTCVGVCSATTFASWRFTDAWVGPGNYKVGCRIPPANADAKVEYRVGGGSATRYKRVDQASYRGEWRTLGTWSFTEPPYIWMVNDTSGVGGRFGVDACRIQYIP